MKNEQLTAAVRLALVAGAVTSLTPAEQAAAQAQPAAQPAETLQEITVTGSRIRRVEAETASPVFVLDQSAIAASGVQTIGDLIQQVPAISGSAQNGQVNNGGGFGESNVELRGLNSKRTLVLLNGRRVGLVGSSGAVDVNQIPIAIIERVEVLKEGAGAVYGSDAIAGVVNFITRKNVDGLEFNADYGRTAKSDGQHHSLSALWGGGNDRLNVLFGGSYSQQDAVYASRRDYSKYALYLYSGVVTRGGSSRIPTGRVGLKAPLNGPTPGGFGCTSVTRIAGHDGKTLADYRCFHGSDAFNYQPYNLIITPQERAAVFTTLNYKLNDSVEAYGQILFNRTSSGFEYAPLPFDATADDVIVSAQSIYNPFGYNFGGFNTPNPNLRVRLLSLGDRKSTAVSDSKLANVGLKGNLFSTDWRWDVNVGYGRLDQNQNVAGYFYKPGLQAAVGPSFLNGTVPTCGTPANPIAGCTPVDMFNLTDPANATNFGLNSTDYSTDRTYRNKTVSASLDGNLFQLPAGPLAAAVGFEYSKQEGLFSNDHLATAQPPLFTKCLISNEACTGPSSGAYDQRDLYAEFLVPVVKNVPGIYALNLTAGVRYSDYSLFGSTTKSQLKIEYRPIADVLVRGTYAQVYRVPTISDLYAAPTQSNPTYADPCLNLTPAKLAATPGLANACVNVPTDGSYKFLGTSQITSTILSNINLKPESGDVVTYGIVYDSSAVRGLSMNIDAWYYKIDNVITQLDPNYASQQCIATGSAAYCGLITRIAGGPDAGQVAVFALPTVNLGELKTHGIDFGVKYVVPNTSIGGWRFSLDATHIGSYQNTVGGNTNEFAGTFNRQFGNFAKWRALGGVGWNGFGADAQLMARYIGKLDILNADGAIPNVTLPRESVTYLDLTLGYLLPTKTKVQVGIQNLTDKQPPLFYQNNVLNANTDVSTYDTLGRRFFVSFNQKF